MALAEEFDPVLNPIGEGDDADTDENHDANEQPQTGQRRPQEDGERDERDQQENSHERIVARTRSAPDHGCRAGRGRYGDQGGRSGKGERSESPCLLLADGESSKGLGRGLTSS